MTLSNMMMVVLFQVCSGSSGSTGKVQNSRSPCENGTCPSFVQMKNSLRSLDEDGGPKEMFEEWKEKRSNNDPVFHTEEKGWSEGESELEVEQEDMEVFVAEEDDEDRNIFDTKEADDTEKEEEERSLLETETNASFEAWKSKFHASLGLGDMCSHFKWDFPMVCRGPTGKANNNGKCGPPNYWDDGMDSSKPVHTGLTPCEANRCLGKPAGGRGNEPFMGQKAGWKPCKPPSNQEDYQTAFGYSWKPPGENRTCVPVCVNRKRGKSYRKVMCNTLAMVEYGKGLRQGSAHCKKPRKNCDFSDHTRDAFYRSAGFGKKCKENFNTTVYDTCARDPGTPTNCEVTAGGKKWNVLNTCWDGAWDKMCRANKCFALKSLTDQKCVTTCKSYGGNNVDYGPYDECADAWALAGCPADGKSYERINPCENSTEPPSAAETAFGLSVAPGERDETLGVMPPTDTTTTVPVVETTVEPELTPEPVLDPITQPTPEPIPDPAPQQTPEQVLTPAGKEPCTASCVDEFVNNCMPHWRNRKKKSPEGAYSQCRGEIDINFKFLKNAGCKPNCASTPEMCAGHKGCD